ncbi:hypothetical protein P170DRAFT_152714 [Aspergillus steynii IBT 23096]|uniref:Uncharacterized protein n=1 Tax=Aspergillus steynii IBT 23096 TaxID=1392250 RepID=A0A2I2GCX4_9EURO|nr:uncharacterized protein P170DRAFT_152714 [Aspergillus steynii IBT 23096]PLB50733.1 hypothetical protein P170DRAFT_152714 [Aspergillus steynii IBT 23096]
MEGTECYVSDATGGIGKREGSREYAKAHVEGRFSTRCRSTSGCSGQPRGGEISRDNKIRGGVIQTFLRPQEIPAMGDTAYCVALDLVMGFRVKRTSYHTPSGMIGHRLIRYCMTSCPSDQGPSSGWDGTVLSRQAIMGWGTLTPALTLALTHGLRFFWASSQAKTPKA